jgi:tetratricopeptide (TPR) repeat protein
MASRMRMKATLTIRSVFSSIFLLYAVLATGTETMSPDEAFRKAVELTNASQHAEAIPLFLIAYRAFPENDAVLWNLGVASAEVNDSHEALKYWLSYRKLKPQDWRAYAKLIQTYQALGDTEARDREQSALFELRRTSSPDSEIRKVEYFCREQMTIARKKTFAFEFFEPKGDQQVFLMFVISTVSGKEEFRITLGSYENTNQIAWETGSLSKDKRLYHIDRYDRNGHSTYGFYETKPSYESVRTKVTEILNNQTKPLSSTTHK